MDVSFLQGLLGRRRSVRGWDFGEAGVVTVLWKGKQSSALVYPRVPKVGWEASGGSFSHIIVENANF